MSEENNSPLAKLFGAFPDFPEPTPSAAPVVDVPAPVTELVSAATALREASHPSDREDAACRLNAALDAMPTLASRTDYGEEIAELRRLLLTRVEASRLDEVNARIADLEKALALKEETITNLRYAGQRFVIENAKLSEIARCVGQMIDAHNPDLVGDRPSFSSAEKYAYRAYESWQASQKRSDP